MNIISKLPQTETSIFAIMSGLANRHNAINLSQGFPDFAISQELIDRIHQKMNEGFNQYAPMPGTISIRQRIAGKMKSLYNADYDWETEITLTAGATQALYTAITAFINPGDEAILFEPAYDSYKPAVEINGGIVRPISVYAPNFKIDWNKVKDTINTHTKLIIVNTPNNPTGSLLQKEDFLALQEITRNTNIVVISDEVYEHIIFDGYQHQSAALFPELAERTILTYSFGKTFHATGWKLGYAIAPRKLMNEFRKIHQFIVFTVNTPIQLAIAEYMEEPENYLKLPAFYQKKRDFFINAIKDSKFNPVNCYGTYFQLVDYSEISDLPELEFAKLLTEKYGVASIPIAPFYHDRRNQHLLRFCFAKTEDTLKKAGEILSSI